MEELFRSLESNQRRLVDDAKTRFREQLNGSKEPWLVNCLVDYYLVSNSIRAVDLLVTIRETHDKYLFDRLAESLRSSQSRRAALTLLGHIVQRQPTWLYKIVRHPTLMKELLNILKEETDMVEVISALLVLNVLLPKIPGLIGSHLNEIFQVFSHLAAWNSDNPNKASPHLLHLQVALYALFYQLYGMFPCTFLSYLQKEYKKKCDSANCYVFHHTIKPMIETVRLHPFLVMSSCEEEICSDRWKKLEHHDVVYNCTRFLLDAGERPCPDDSASSLKSPHPISSLDPSNALLECSRFVEPETPNVSSTLNYLNSGTDTPTFTLCSQLDVETMSGNTTPAPTGIESTPTSIPHTPIFKMYSSSSLNQHEGSSPPEAAIEATPETTPVKDVRHATRTNMGSSQAVRALHQFPSPNDTYVKRQHGDTPPSSPMKTKDIFNFPSNAESRKVSKLFDERFLAQEMFITGNERKSTGGPSSPFNIISPQDSFSGEDRDADTSNHSAHLSESTTNKDSKSKSDFMDSDLFFDEDCSQDSESPCSRGGLHMPTSSSIRNFRSRPRYQTETNIPTSQSLGLSIGSSPREGFQFPLAESRVRRANSCPEMKKSTGGSLTSSIVSTTMPLREQDEDEEVKTGKIVPLYTEDHSTQTDNSPADLAPYEHLFLGIFPVSSSYHHPVYVSPASGTPESSYLNAHSVEACCERNPKEPVSTNMFKPYESLDKVVDVTTRHRSKSNAESEIRFYKEQLYLMNLQLHFERHRRAVHSEMNRRLLGKSRNNRASEEHMSALRDQVSLIQSDMENAIEEMNNCQNECRSRVETLENNVERLKSDNLELHKQVSKYKSKCENLEQDMKSEHETRSILNNILHETKAKLFDSNNEMESYKQAVLENKKLNNDMFYLQKELMILGEMNTKYKDTLSYLAQLKNENVYSDLFNQAYVHQIQRLQKLYDNQSTLLESIQNKNLQLETKMFEKDKNIQRFKILFASIKQEYLESLEQLTIRCNSLQSNLSRERKELQECFYQLELCQGKLAKYAQKYPNFDKSLTSSLGPIPSTSQPNNPNNVMSLSIFLDHDSERLEPRTDTNKQMKD